MKLRLTQGDKVLFDVALPDPQGGAVSDWSVLLGDDDVQKLCALYSMGANPKRLRVMLELASGGALRFSDIMQIATNPKLAQDCLQPMLREGLILHGERGSTYRISERALPLILTLTLGLSKMLSVLGEETAPEEEDSKA